jgi:hypothetical protein
MFDCWGACKGGEIGHEPVGLIRECHDRDIILFHAEWVSQPEAHANGQPALSVRIALRE